MLDEQVQGELGHDIRPYGLMEWRIANFKKNCFNLYGQTRCRAPTRACVPDSQLELIKNGVG